MRLNPVDQPAAQFFAFRLIVMVVAPLHSVLVIDLPILLRTERM